MIVKQETGFSLDMHTHRSWTQINITGTGCSQGAEKLSVIGKGTNL